MNNLSAYKGENIVFIVGSPRSGTTWLQRLLATHPMIKTGQESKIFTSYLAPQLRAWHWELKRERNVKTTTGRGGTGLSCYFEEDDFLHILRDHMLRLLRPMISELKQGELFIEKTPSHALCIQEIKELLPESKIIHVLRDPRDVVASLLAAGRSWGAGWAPRSPQQAASIWVDHVRAVRKASKSLSERDFFEITYEQLWKSPQISLNSISKFLNLTWDEEEISQAVKTCSREAMKVGNGTQIPVYGEAAKHTGSSVVKEPAGFVRKGQPGTWRTDLSITEKLWVWRITSRTMKEMGY